MNEAIRLHNEVPQGLSSAIFTESIKDAETFLSAIGSDCGIANVNIRTSGAEIGEHLGAKKRQAEEESLNQMHGSNTCVARRAQLIGVMSFL
jgi:acyl-CoA reductase-like NAD-dependent aldehyde dehydrogenase